MAAADIKAKALRCIDEIYPSADTLNDTYFPVDDFIGEAARWVIDIAPVHTLTKHSDVKTGEGIVDADGMGYVGHTKDERIVYFKADDWKRPVFGVITEDDPRYIQQSNKVLRGNPSRPVVAWVKGKTVLEWYTTNEEGYSILSVPYDIEYIPDELESLAAWKLAEIVLMSMHDVQSASICTAKVNEHLAQL